MSGKRENKIFESSLNCLNENDNDTYLTTRNLLESITDKEYVTNLLDKNEESLIEIITPVDSKFTVRNNDIVKLNDAYGRFRNAFLISFESTVSGDCVIYWKETKAETFLGIKMFFELEINEKFDINILTQKFIKKSLNDGYMGLCDELIESTKWNEINLTPIQLADSRQYNLLMFASEINESSVIESLLKIGFSVNDKIWRVTAADIAWKNKSYNALLKLLLNNSCYPQSKSFQEYESNGDEIIPELRALFRQSTSMADAVKTSNLEEIEKIIQENPDLKHFYSLGNISAAKQALKCKNLELYEYFLVRGVKFGPYEITSSVIDELKDKDREKLRLLHSSQSKCLPEQHVNILIAKSSIGFDTENIEEKRNYIEEAFYFLNSIALVQIILKCVAVSRKFNIVFDFNREHVQFLDPTVSDDSNGLFDRLMGRLYIGAKKIFNTSSRMSVYGVISHEFCHYALFLAYRNSGNPYKKGDKKSMRKFDQIVNYCMRNSRLEPIIDGVYECYTDDLWHAELIVRIPQLLTLYHNQPEKMKRVRTLFKPLFDYYETKVVKDLEHALPEINRRTENQIKQKENEIVILRFLIVLISFLVLTALGFLGYFIYINVREINWSNLNTIEKNFVRERNVNFQGYYTKMDMLIDNENTYSLLKSQEIKCLLEPNCDLIIGNKIKSKEGIYIERHFKNVESGVISFDFVKNEIIRRSSRTFVLLDNVGSGKSFAIRKLADELKKSEQSNKWIEVIDVQEIEQENLVTEKLGKSQDINLKNFKIESMNHTFLKNLHDMYVKRTSLEDIKHELKCKNTNFGFNFWVFKKFKEDNNYFCETMNSAAVFEVLRKMYNDGNVILFWDNINNNFQKANVVNVAKSILQDAKKTNVQFLALRGRLSNDTFIHEEENRFELVPYSDDDRNEYLVKFVTSDNKFDPAKDAKRIVKRQNEMNNLLNDMNKGKLSTRDLNNPSVLQSLIKKALKSTKLYEFYDEIFNQNSNSAIKSLGVYSLAGHFKTIHQKHAIEHIVKSSDSNINAMNTSLVLNFDDHIQYSADDINSFGLMVADESNESYFLYDNYAEFFVAQFIIENIYLKDILFSDDIVEMQLKFLFDILSQSSFTKIHTFIFDFISSSGSRNIQKRNTNKIIMKNFRNIFNEYLLMDDFLEYVKRVCDFFAKDKNILKSLWRFNEDETFYIWYFKEAKRDNLHDLKKLAEKYFTEKEVAKIIFGNKQNGNIIFSMAYLSSAKKASTEIYKNDILNSRSKYLNELFFEDLTVKKVFDSKNLFDNFNNIVIRNAYQIVDYIVTFYKDSKKLPRGISFEALFKVLEQEDYWKSFVHTIDSNTGNTIFHLLATHNGAMSDFIKHIIFEVPDEILLTQNYNEKRSALIVASENLNIQAFSDFRKKLYDPKMQENKQFAKKILTMLDSKTFSLFESSMENLNEGVFSKEVFPLYQNYLDDDEMYKLMTSRDKPLSFLFDGKFDSNRVGVFLDKFEPFFYKLFGDSPDKIEKLFVSENQFADFVSKITSPKNKYFDLSIKILKFIVSISDAQKEKLKNIFKMQQEELANSLQSDTSNIDIVRNGKDFLTCYLSIYDKERYELAKALYQNGTIIYDVIRDVFGDINKIRPFQNISSYANPFQNFPFSSIYPVFENYIEKRLGNDTKYYKNILQLLAVNGTFSLDYSKTLEEYFSSEEDNICELDLFDKKCKFKNIEIEMFLVSQYIIENLYMQERSLHSNDIPVEADFNVFTYESCINNNYTGITNDNFLKICKDICLLSTIWDAKENDAKKIINKFIHEFLQYERTKPGEFSQNVRLFLQNFLHSGYSISSLCEYDVDIDVLERISEFIERDRELLNKFWDINSEISNVLLWFIIYRTDEATNLWKIVNNIVSVEINDLQGIVLYTLYENICPNSFVNFDKVLKFIRIEKELINLQILEGKTNFHDFFIYVERAISKSSISKLLSYKSSAKILQESLKVSECLFNEFWEKMNYLEMLYEIFGFNLKDNDRQKLFFNLNIANSIQVLRSYIILIKENLLKERKEEEYFDILVNPLYLEGSALNRLIKNDNRGKNIKVFWNEAVSFLSVEQKRKLLNQIDENGHRALELSLIHDSENERLSSFFINISSEIFVDELRRDFILDAKHSLLFLIKSEEQANELAHFIFDAFDDDTSDLLEEYLDRQNENNQSAFNLPNRCLLLSIIFKSQSFFKNYPEKVSKYGNIENCYRIPTIAFTYPPYPPARTTTFPPSPKICFLDSSRSLEAWIRDYLD